MRNSLEGLCCWSRTPNAQWVSEDLWDCVEDFAPGITVPIGMRPPLFVSGTESTLCAQGLRFAPNSTTLETLPSSLDAMAESLQGEPVETVFLYGSCLAGEAATERACEALGHARVRVVVEELTRRGVPQERLVEQTLSEFESTRTDPTEQKMLKDLGAPVVWVYGSPPDPLSAPPPPPEPCYPGVEAELTLTEKEFVTYPGSSLVVHVCLAGGCARGELALDTLAVGDKVVWRLDGYPSTGMLLDWRARDVRFVVRTQAPPARLLSGDRYKLTLDLGSKRLRTLDTRLQFPEGDACRVAVVR